MARKQAPSLELFRMFVSDGMDSLSGNHDRVQNEFNSAELDIIENWYLRGKTAFATAKYLLEGG